MSQVYVAQNGTQLTVDQYTDSVDRRPLPAHIVDQQSRPVRVDLAQNPSPNAVIPPNNNQEE
jgi:hypothetical protein